MAEKTVSLSGQQIAVAFQQEKLKLEEIERRMVSVQNLMQEIFFAKESIESIKKTKKGEKAIVPLGAGMHVDVKIDSNTKIKTILAGNVIIETGTEEALKTLEKREKEAQEKAEELQKQQQSLYANLNTLGQIISKAQQARQEQND